MTRGTGRGDWEHQTTAAATGAVAVGTLGAVVATAGVFVVPYNVVIGAAALGGGFAMLVAFVALVLDYALPRIP